MKYLFYFGLHSRSSGQLSAKTALLLALTAWSFLTLGSCTADRFLTEVDIDLENPEVDLVLESTIRLSDTLLTVYFSHSQSLLEATSASLIEGASVEVFINDVSLGLLEEKLVTNWRDNQLGSIYRLPLDGDQLIAGDEVRIEATAPSGKMVRAVERMPNAANIVSATYFQGRPTLGYSDSDNSIRLEIDDPGQQENHYVFFGEEVSIKLQPLPTGQVDTLSFRNDINLDPGDQFTVGEFIDNPMASDLSFDGARGLVVLGTWWVPRMPPSIQQTQVWITLGAINKSAYDYDKTLDAVLGLEGNPFAEPAILPSSIEHGRGVLRLINDAASIEARLE